MDKHLFVVISANVHLVPGGLFDFYFNRVFFSFFLFRSLTSTHRVLMFFFFSDTRRNSSSVTRGGSFETKRAVYAHYAV